MIWLGFCCSIGHFRLDFDLLSNSYCLNFGRLQVDYFESHWFLVSGEQIYLKWLSINSLALPITFSYPPHLTEAVFFYLFSEKWIFYACVRQISGSTLSTSRNLRISYNDIER